MNSILQKIVRTKHDEIAEAKRHRSIQDLRHAAEIAPAPRDFLGALAGHQRMRLIAEVKKLVHRKGLFATRSILWQSHMLTRPAVQLL